jgi:hypothetical protein
MMQSATEYLVSFGKSGEFGRFASVEPLACRRGDPLVIETSRGLELGQVIRRSDPEHARLMGGGAAGRIVRRPTPNDLELRNKLRARGQLFFDDARHRAGDLGLPLEIVDAEILLEGRQAVLHVLRWGEADLKPLTDAFVHSHGLLTLIHDLALPASPEEPALDPAEPGCGSGDCGSGGCGSGGCGTGGCGSCSTGGCSATAHTHSPADTRPQAISLL